MAGTALPIMHTIDRDRGSLATPAGNDLLALLKVRTLHAVLVTLLIVAQYWLELAASLGDRPVLLGETFFLMLSRNIWYWLVGFAMIAVLQTRMRPGRLRTTMLICGALVWVGLWRLITERWLGTYFIVEMGFVSPAAVSADGMWTTTTYLLLAVWYYESADRARRATAVFRESKLARESAERWLLELRLGALQARLDPQVLFDALDEAGRLYRSRRAAAEALLDALIDYLRLALPQQRQSESTLSREIALAVAYARVLRIPNGEPLGLDSNVAVAVGDARFPPMVVQPLCDAMARSTVAGGVPARMEISASLESDEARLCITAHPARTALASKRLDEIRHTLLAMFGPFVRMDATGPTAGVISVLVEVPYDPAPRVDR